MKKGFIATLFAALLAFVCVTPAFAAEVSTAEQVPFDSFCAVLEKYRGEANLDAEHIAQYQSEARSALLKVDLSDTACKEFSEVVTKCDNILDGSKTRAQMWAHVNELLSVINGVAEKYGMHVSVNATSKFATVTVTTKGGTSVIADTSKTVKQTGFDVAQSVVVAAGAAAVLAVGFVLVRKNHLFE